MLFIDAKTYYTMLVSFQKWYVKEYTKDVAFYHKIARLTASETNLFTTLNCMYIG